MTADMHSNEPEAPAKTRRDLIRTSARVAVTAPAVAVLLHASAKRAKAAPVYGGGSNNNIGPGDDGFFDDVTVP